LFIVILVCYKIVQDKLPYYNKDRGECDNPRHLIENVGVTVGITPTQLEMTHILRTSIRFYDAKVGQKGAFFKGL